MVSEIDFGRLLDKISWILHRCLCHKCTTFRYDPNVVDLLFNSPCEGQGSHVWGSIRTCPTLVN